MAYPSCNLVVATDELDFVAELKEQIKLHHLNGEVITYETVRPAHARTRLWSVACGREAVRRHVLSKGAEFLLFLDGDMIFEPSVISIMKSKIKDFKVASSGYRGPACGVWVFGAGCLLINREILSKLTFQCYEFSNGEVIDESEALDWSLFKCHARVNKGVFVSIKHYWNSRDYYTARPHSVGWFRTLTNNLLLRFILIQISILIRYNIARKLQSWVYRVPKRLN